MTSNYPGDRLKASGNVYTLRELANLFKEMFDIVKGSNDVLNGVEFYQEYPQGTPPEDLKLPAITFRLGDRKPIEARANVFTPHYRHRPAEIKPRYREDFPDPNNPGYVIVINGQIYQNEVRFDVWSTSNRQADIIADEFERFIKNYTGILMNRGIQQIIYSGMKTDEAVNWRDTVTHRIITYELRTEEITVISSKTIEEINFNIEVKTGQKKKDYRIADDDSMIDLEEIGEIGQSETDIIHIDAQEHADTNALPPNIITFQEDNNLESVEVKVYEDDGGRVGDQVGDPVYTDSNGQAHKHLEDGQYIATASKNNYYGWNTSFTVSGEHKTFSFTLEIVPLVTFVETNSEENVVIQRYSSPERTEGDKVGDPVYTNNDGVATMYVGSGIWFFTASKEGFSDKDFDIEVADEDKTVEFTLS